MAFNWGGLGLGLGQIGAGVSRGELAGTQWSAAAAQKKAQMDALAAWHDAQLKSQQSIADEKIDQQQRASAGRTADAIDRALQSTEQQDNFRRMPGLRDQMIQERNVRRRIQSGDLPWKAAPLTKFVDPVTGEVSLPQGSGTPSPAPWTPGAGQTAADNPYLGTKGQQGAQRIATGRENADVNKAFKVGPGGLLTHFGNQDAIAGTHENAALADQQFDRQMKLAQAQLQAGHLGFQEQFQVWARLLSAAGQTARAGGD